jgi:hypothetical protein
MTQKATTLTVTSCASRFNDACVQSGLRSVEFFSTVVLTANYVTARAVELGGM